MPQIRCKILNPVGSLHSPVPVSPSILKRPAFDRASHNSYQMLLFAHVCLLLTGAGEFFTNDSLVQGLTGFNLPAPGPVSPRGFSNGSVPPENDTNLDYPGRYPSRVVPDFTSPPCSNTRIQGVYMSPYLEPHEVTHHTIQECSPFGFCALVLALTFNVLGILSPGSIFFQARVCLLSLGLVVLPLCAHHQNRLTRMSYCTARCRHKSEFRILVKRTFSDHMIGFMIIVLFLWVVSVSLAAPNSCPFPL